MTILVLAEYDANELKPATLAAVTAAGQLGGDVHLMLLGDDPSAAAAKAATLSGVAKIIVGRDAALRNLLAEQVTQAVMSLAADYEFFVAAATSFGKNVMPRIAALLDVQQISDVITIEAPTRFVRPIYAGNALQTVETAQEKNVLTIRATRFAAAEYGSEKPSVIEERQFAVPTMRGRFVRLDSAVSDRPELTSAKIVVAGGRGVGSKENFRIIEELADDLHAAVGASRAAVDAGYVPNDYQVGQTGKIVAPDLYIAIGISGAIQHLAGMVGSKTVVAINKDADAPIFQVADYGLAGDLFDILPKLREQLKS